MRAAAAVLISGLVALVLLAQATPGTATADVEVSRVETVEGRYIVLFRPGVNAQAETQRLEQTLGFTASHVYTAAVRGFAANLPARALNGLQRNPNVVLIEPDQIARAFPQSEPTGIRRTQADQNATAKIDGTDDVLDIDVAVIDTGSGPHGELNVAGGFASYGQCTGSWLEILYCQAGLLFAPTCGFSDSYSDGHGHGTHVAGTIGARDDNEGVVGMAPGANIWSVRVLGPEGIGCYSDIIAGVDWVTANAATIEVANMSLGGPDSAALCSALANSVAAGVTYAVAAGNSATDASNTSPANCPEAITVSAIADYNGEAGGGAAATCTDYGADDHFATFSSFGSVVDIAAPGVCIASTWPGGYNTISGTSMATPHVAGAAALLKAANPAWSPAQVRTALLANSFQPGSACYFSGDPDSHPEPLLNVGPACALDGPVPPSVTINQATNQPDPTNASSISFTVVFSEAVQGFDNADVAVGGTAGATNVAVSGGPSTYTVAVSGMIADGTITASVPAGVATAVDDGSPSEASTSTDNVVAYDATAPTVAIEQASNQDDPTSDSPINFTVVFSEPVSGFDAVDVTVGGTAGATTVQVAGGPTTYSVAVSGMQQTGTVIASVSAGAATDAAGNPSLASTSSDNAVTYEVSATPPPALDITSIDPDHINFSSGMSTTVTIYGVGIGEGATVSLTGGSGPAPTTSVLGVAADGTSLQVVLQFKAGGPPKSRTWNVQVVNSDGASDVLPGAFTVFP